MTPLHLNTSTVIKLLIAASAITASSAFATPTITYVPDSLAQSSIHQGPWVLHQHNEEAQYDASGILPSLAIPALQTDPPIHKRWYTLR
jgi:hypothetical protein